MRFRISPSAGFLVMFAAVSCRQQMAEQPRYEPYQQSAFFADSLSARPLPEGVVSRTSVERNVEPVVTIDLLRRGRQRFNIYCVPCHGYTGEGNGMVSVRGLSRPPPTFHNERLRSAELRYFYDVIEKGFGAMPSYAYQVTPDERWAIATYIKALQLSQWAPVDTVPPEERQRLEREAQ